MAGDLLKGVLAVALALWLAPGTPAPELAALAVVAGHIHPLQLRFRGGKGLATALGSVLLATPLGAAVGAVVALAWLGATRKAVEAALLGVAAMPIVVLLARPLGVGSVALTLLSGLVLLRHAGVIRGLVVARRSA
jgi:acyl phosphate:glycerol-3-phosphate acyltransferase